jgi:hypothetical protein
MNKLPHGSWINSARNYKVVNNVLYAELEDIFGFWHKNVIFIEYDKYYDNKNGRFFKHQKIINNKPNKWCILLTTAIGVGKETEFRKELYIKQIKKWLSNTNYFIFVVESTGNGNFFDDIKNEYINRIDIISIELEKNPSSSILEALSIKEAMKYILESNIGEYITHILKVTGRYFLYDIQNSLENLTQDLDFYIQIHTNHNIEWQNTEYYGIKKNLMIPLMDNVIENKNFMENNFYKYINQKHFNLSILGPFPNNIKRGGDKQIILNL